jgi:hypothetical protein
MNTTAQISQPPRSSEPTFGETLAELVPLIDFVPQAGPPVVFVLGPWLFLVLMLAAPFACLVTLVVAMTVAAVVLVAVSGAVLFLLAAPYLLVRHLRRHWTHHPSARAPGAPVVAIDSRGVAA